MGVPTYVCMCFVPGFVNMTKGSVCLTHTVDRVRNSVRKLPFPLRGSRHPVLPLQP